MLCENNPPLRFYLCISIFLPVIALVLSQDAAATLGKETVVALDGNYQAVYFDTGGAINAQGAGEFPMFTTHRPPITDEYSLALWVRGYWYGGGTFVSQPQGRDIHNYPQYFDFYLRQQHLTVTTPRQSRSNFRFSIPLGKATPRGNDPNYSPLFHCVITVNKRTTSLYTNGILRHQYSGDQDDLPILKDAPIYLLPYSNKTEFQKVSLGGVKGPVVLANKAFSATEVLDLFKSQGGFLPPSPSSPQTYEHKDPIEFSNQKSLRVGGHALGPIFSVSADLRVDKSWGWVHVVEVGGTEYGMNAPLRIQVDAGREGIWFIAGSVGNAPFSAEFKGNWKFGQKTSFLFTYENGAWKFYEQGKLLHQVSGSGHSQIAHGSLFLGSHKGTERFLQGQMSNIVIKPELLPPHTGQPPPANTPPVPPTATTPTAFERLAPKDYTGHTVDNIGMMQLSPSFSVSADVRLNASHQWIHLIEVGGAEFGMSAPFRLETGNQGEWYVALSNGQELRDFQKQGNWTFGQTVNVLFTYENGLCKLYENGNLLGQFQAPQGAHTRPGQLILGSHKGTERFLYGQLSNIVIKPQLLPPSPASNPPLYSHAGTQIFDGQTTHNVGSVTLPPSFTVSADVKVSASDQWRHLIEVGCLERSWHAPFRLEVGNEGQWYFAIGDGSSYVDADFQGNWRYNQPVSIVLTYANGVAKFYENQQLLHQVPINKNVSAMPGSLILGSYQGTQRFFQGEMSNIAIRAGEHPPQ